MFDEKKLRKLLKGKKNYRGHGKKLVKRIRDGIEVDEEVIVIGVESKVPLEALALADRIPDEFDGIKTDVIVVGKVVAMGTKDKCDPLVAGYSIGNIGITAGTLCWYFTKIGQTEELLGSNAHVFSDSIGSTSSDKRIVQQGPLDGGLLPQAATLLWHTQLKRDLNPLNALWMILANLIFQLLGQQPPYDLTDSKPNHLDFAVAKPNRSYVKEIAGLSSFDDFTGIYFAGSDYKSFFCKAKYITQAGYKPVDVNVKEAKVGDTIYKGDGRTSPRNTSLVLDDSWFLYVNYGGYGMDRPFDDVVMTDPIIDGGDSGTAVWLDAVFH